MKTNQIMIRPMGEFKVTQRTKDLFLKNCLTFKLYRLCQKQNL